MNHMLEITALAQVRRALVEWKKTQNYFESVKDEDLVDYAVYEMEAARRKYMLLLKRYAAAEHQ